MLRASKWCRLHLFYASIKRRCKTINLSLPHATEHATGPTNRYSGTLRSSLHSQQRKTDSNINYNPVRNKSRHLFNINLNVTKTQTGHSKDGNGVQTHFSPTYRRIRRRNNHDPKWLSLGSTNVSEVLTASIFKAKCPQ
jgi:hypothetical protein